MKIMFRIENIMRTINNGYLVVKNYAKNQIRDGAVINYHGIKNKSFYKSKKRGR